MLAFHSEFDGLNQYVQQLLPSGYCIRQYPSLHKQCCEFPALTTSHANVSHSSPGGHNSQWGSYNWGRPGRHPAKLTKRAISGPHHPTATQLSDPHLTLPQPHNDSINTTPPHSTQPRNTQPHNTQSHNTYPPPPPHNNSPTTPHRQHPYNSSSRNNLTITTPPYNTTPKKPPSNIPIIPPQQCPHSNSPTTPSPSQCIICGDNTNLV